MDDISCVFLHKTRCPSWPMLYPSQVFVPEEFPHPRTSQKQYHQTVLEIFFSDSAQRRARTCIGIFAFIERRRSSTALEEKIASQVSWTFDGISTRCPWHLLRCCTPRLARECSKDKPIIVNEDAELLVQRRENRPSLRIFVLANVLWAEIRRQLVIKSLMNGVTSQPHPVGAKPRARTS